MESSSKSRSGSAAVKWLLEGLLIIVSVLLAFAVDEYRDNRANRELTLRVLDGIKTEVEHNLATVEPYVPMHKTWLGALEHADVSNDRQSALDVWFATRPSSDRETPFPTLRRSAWDAAVSSGALRQVDFDVAAAMADVYSMQEQLTANVKRLENGPLSSTATYDPASRRASVKLMWLTLADIEYAEELLAKRYHQHLPILEKAAR